MLNAASLTDDALILEVGRLAGREREATAALIVHLAEFDARRLYEGAGYSSMFSYCRAVLRLSEDAACNRIKAARMVRLFPKIVGMLIDGALSPTTVRLLARHLTTENHEQLLAAASGKGKDAVEELIACQFPKPDVASSVRKVRERRIAPNVAALDTAQAEPGRSLPSVPPASLPPASVPPALAPPAMTPPALPPPALPSGTLPPHAASVIALTPPKPALVRPLAPERYEIRFTADAETRQLLREAQDLLGHALPSGDIAAVFKRSLTVLVADLKRRKFSATSRPRPRAVANEFGRRPSAVVQREVSARDENRCAYVAKDGHRCEERRFLEFHHDVVPFARGGRSTADNIQLRCRAHNGYEVDRFFGPGKRWTKDRMAAVIPAWARSGGHPFQDG